MSATMVNVSGRPLEIETIETLIPLGANSVIKVKRVEVAPLFGRGPGYFKSTPGGLYKIYPPVLQEKGHERCHVQETREVSGYVLDPEAEARILVWLVGVGPGRFKILGNRVLYRQEGTVYEQRLLVGQSGRVAEGARGLRVEPSEKPCVKKGYARVLPTP